MYFIERERQRERERRERERRERYINMCVEREKI